MDFKGIAKAVARTVFIIVNNIYCIPTFLLWMLTLSPLLYIKPAVYWWIEGTLFHWLLMLISNWLWTAGYYIAEVGEDIRECRHDKCLVLVNHQSTGDVLVLMNSLQNKGTTSARVCWIMDYIFKYTNFGWVSLRHGDFFIQQGKQYRDKQLQYLQRHLQEVYLPRGRQWLFLFPEGGFLRKRRENSQKFARKNNYPILQHVTLPRIGALHTILKTLVLPKQTDVSNGYVYKGTQGLKWVIDITIGYPENRPLDIFQVLSGSRPSCTTVLYCRKYPIGEVPTDEDQLLKWIYARFEEKEHMLERFYATGEFAVDASMHSPSHDGALIQTPRMVKLDRITILLLHSVFILSSYFHCYLIYSGWNWLMSWL